MDTSLHSVTLHPRPAPLATATAAPLQPTDHDRSLALGLLLLGATGAMTASLSQPHPLSMEAGMDGCLVVGPVALLLALLEGVRWRKAVAVLTPVFALQLLACFRYRVSPAAVMGMEAMIVGGLGAVAESIRRQRAVASTTRAPDARYAMQLAAPARAGPMKMAVVETPCRGAASKGIRSARRSARAGGSR